MQLGRWATGSLIPVDGGIIAATLRDLEQDVLEGRFRDDLFYRLHVISLRIPPLRERKEDIPLLVNYFLQKNQEKLGLNVIGIKRDALSLLLDYHWPGNIRELENCIERAMILTEGEEITRQSLPPQFREKDAPTSLPELDGSSLSIKKHSRTIEENLIRRALEQTRGNRTHAAKLLEISHRTLLYKLKEYGIESPHENERE
jgi:two-component system, NtrC family, response regulator AtoC